VGFLFLILTINPIIIFAYSASKKVSSYQKNERNKIKNIKSILMTIALTMVFLVPMGAQDVLAHDGGPLHNLVHKVNQYIQSNANDH